MKIKYIRTKDERIIPFLGKDRETKLPERHLRFYYIQPNNAIAFIDKNEIIKQANTIEELCDEFVVVANYGIGEGANPGIIDKENIHKFLYSLGEWTIYGAIWTNKGLIYVAKMNYKGESELI